MSRRNPIPRNRREAEELDRSFSVIARMRRERLRLKPAAEREGIPPDTVEHWLGSLLHKKRPKGDYYAKAYDRIPREVRFLTPQGRVWITVRDSRTRSQIGQYMGLVGNLGRTTDPESLKRFKSRTFSAEGKTYSFITDFAVIAQLESADELAIEGLYREVGAR